MRELSLFSGAGGGLLASVLLGWRTIGAVEFNEYCCKVLEQRQIDGCLDAFPIWHMDIREFNKRIAPSYTGMVDVVSAGFPCQPFSTAGKQAGADDPRNTWPATIECIRVVRPRFAFLENVPGLIATGYFDTVIGDLTESGYDCRWRVLSAAELGAPHLRKRLWVVADSGKGTFRALDKQPACSKEWISKQRREDWIVFLVDVNGVSLGKWRSTRFGVDTRPVMWRSPDGLAPKLDRIESIGNGQVPIVAATAWRLLTGSPVVTKGES